jgi:release factor glutamine methyltransferase
LGEILRKSEEFLVRKGIENARGDSRRLMAHGLSLTPMEVILQFERPLTASEVSALRDLVVRRGNNEPLQHIEGSVGFRHLDFRCDARALVPRPETEFLVEIALNRLEGIAKPRVHEVGVGSGCVGLSLRHERADLRATGSDLSSKALDLTRENALRLGIWFPVWLGDLLDGLKPESLDAVVSNPPYIPSRDIAGLSAEVRADPRLALDGGPDGLDAIRTLVRQAAVALRPGGWLLLEHGHDQGASTRALCADGWTDVETRRDLSGTERFLAARRA